MGKSSYYWSHDEEKKLRDLWNSGNHNVDSLASLLSRTGQAVEKKIRRLGLAGNKLVVGAEKKLGTTTTNIELPEDLPNVETVLASSAAALKALEAPGLDPNEVLRLKSIISGVKVYKGMLADYLDFRGLEARLFELEAKYAGLVKGRRAAVEPRIVRKGSFAETVRVKDLEAE